MNYRNEDSDADEDDTEPSRYHPVSCTGLQPDSKVFVFGPEFQIEEDGAVISQEKQQYIWIDAILQKLQRTVNSLPPIPNPTLQHLHTIVRGMHSISGDNVFSGLFLLGKF